MAQATNNVGARGRVFRDPVHGLIHIPAEHDFLVDLVDTPEFQRLRRIRQLGVSSFTYPGADHTRFAHSLGVMNFAQRIMESLVRRYGTTHSEVSDLLNENRKVVLAAALLHDIGHGPFSHMMERAFGDKGRHEERTQELILDQNSAVHECLQSHEISPEEVAALIANESPYRLLVDVVSSQLDADRMDYILRDALATGVRYGAYDAEWILNSLCVGKEPNVPGAGAATNWRLCLEEKRGLHSAEQLIIARMHMSYQVYYHKATRGWEAHVLCLLREAHELARTGDLPPGTPDLVAKFLRKEKLSLDEWNLFDEGALQGAMGVWALCKSSRQHAFLNDLSRSYLWRKKRYRCRKLKIKAESSINFFAALSKAGQLERDWFLDPVEFSSYKDYGRTLSKARSANEDEPVSASSILIASGNPDACSEPAEDESVVLETLGKQSRDGAGAFYYLFYHDNIAAAIDAAVKSL